MKFQKVFPAPPDAMHRQDSRGHACHARPEASVPEEVISRHLTCKFFPGPTEFSKGSKEKQPEVLGASNQDSPAGYDSNDLDD